MVVAAERPLGRKEWLRMPRPRGAEELFDWSVHTTEPVIDSSSRRKRDSLGEATVPATAYWGVNTARALENFAISGRSVAEYPDRLWPLLR
jgi:hypothetical protein